MNSSSVMDTHTIEFLSSLRVLVIQSSKEGRSFFHEVLNDLVLELIFAKSKEEAYSLYQSNHIDIIFSDYEMGEYNGLEFSKKIRDEDQNIPIVLLLDVNHTEIIIEALNYNVTKFLQKPLQKDQLLEALTEATKVVIANNYLIDQKKEAEYNRYQEELAFAKELNILRNDFYYQMTGEENISLVDFMYQPLDLISGDAYTARRIDANRTFYLIVDGMGKGLSASLSAMIMTSFVNHLIDKMVEFDSFSLEMLIKESLSYIQPILLEEEALALDYILFDNHYNKLSYSKFAMPVFLLEDLNGNVVKIKSNNPPLSKWQQSYKIDEYSVENFAKFLFYSDGVVENSTKVDGKTYADFIENDFKDSFTREEFKEKLLSRISAQEDDLTMIFINKLDFRDSYVAKKTFTTSMESLDEANKWYEELWKEISDDVSASYRASVVFTELFMNAYEHGNLGLSSRQKHKLLKEDNYFETLKIKEVGCEKQIEVQVDKIINASSTYIVTQIADEGAGFDTQMLSEIFRNSKKFNGRGVFVSRKNSMGIYFNAKGNRVLFLNKVSL